MIERDSIRFEDTTIEYEIRRSMRRKKTIGITLENGIVRLVAPTRTSADKLRELVRDSAPDIVRSLSLAPPEGVQKRFVSRESMPYMGHDVRIIIRSADVRSPQIRFDSVSGSERFEWSSLDDLVESLLYFGGSPDDARFRIVVPPNMRRKERYEAIRHAFIAWYQERAAEEIKECLDLRWPEIGRRKRPRVLVREQRRQWGSCAADGTLRFNWRLIMLEPRLIEYVVVHELVHLRVRSHSKRFWERVSKIVPDVEGSRRRLRDVEGILPL